MKLRERFKKKEVEKEGKRKRSLKRKKVYVKERCHYHEGNKRCRRNAIGSGQLCALHGGTKDLGNTLSPEATQLYLAEAGVVTKFDPAMHPMQYIDLSRQGLSEVEIAAEMHVGVATVRTWSETFEEFALAHDVGKALHETWWLNKGKGGLNQRNFNTPLFKFLTSNKLGYSEKTESKNLNMNACGVLVVPETISEEQWVAEGVHQKNDKKKKE